MIIDLFEFERLHAPLVDVQVHAQFANAGDYAYWSDRISNVQKIFMLKHPSLCAAVELRAAFETHIRGKDNG